MVVSTVRERARLICRASTQKSAGERMNVAGELAVAAGVVSQTA